MNTKLNLFVADYRCYDEHYLFSYAMETMYKIKNACGYTLDIPMPVTIEVTVTKGTETVNKFFGGGTKTRETRSYEYNLVFDKVLNEQELSLWCMFKMGWRSARWPKYS